MARRKKTNQFKFDVALSFAGTERRHAKALADALAKKKIAAFYDKDHAADLWGKDTKEFEEIYGPQSRFVVPFISEEYVNRDWTNYEFETAKREARLRQSEFILPIRVDDSRLLGLHDSCNYLSLDQFSIEEIADAIEKKLSSTGDKKATGAEKEPSTVVKLLSSDERQALGLLATSPGPLAEPHLLGIFPQVKWKSYLKEFSNSGLITQSDGLFHIESDAEKAFSDEGETKSLKARWIDALTPLKGHPDTALFLGMYLIQDGKIDEAVECLTDVAESLDPGSWRATYVGILEMFAEKTALKTLRTENRFTVLNAVAICHSGGPNPSESLPFLDRLQRNSQRAGEQHWLGQAYLNKGVVFHQVGDRRKSRRWYTKALQLARDQKNPLFEARCLSNLAQLDVESSPERALDLLAESIKLKESIGDDAGVASALEVQAVAFATLGDLESALESYERSYTLAREIGHVYLTCLVELNRAHTLYDFGKRRKALRHVSSGCRIASTEGYDELERRCLELRGTICFDMRKLADSIDCFENLLEKATTSEDFTRALCARHALGVAYRMTGTDEQSGTHFSAGIRLAKKLGEDEWAARCLADRTRALVDGELRAADTQQLRKQAKNQENRGATRLAGLIWRTIAYSLMESDAQIEEVRTALERAAQLLFDADDSKQEWGSAVEELHSFLWDNKFFRDAIEVLQEWTQRAQSRKIFEAECAWLDQRAVCLTQLEDFVEAERLHRKAAKLAERHGFDEQLQRSKHNLGECLLRHGNPEEAAGVLQEAREVARSLDDIESELTAAHSYALVQRDLGNEKVASSTLTECRDRAERLGYWREYVRAWLALANLAWSTGRPKLSERRYRRALKEAKRYRCEDMVADISVNLASLLRNNGKIRQALKLLEAGVEAAKDELNGSVYCIELAETYEAASEPQKAIIAWEEGRTASIVAEDMEGYAICSSRLAELRLRTGQLGDAEEELRSLLSERALPTEDRVIALGQLLRVLIKSAEQRNAQSEYSEFTTLSRCQEFYKHYIDIHMAIFDQGWMSEEGDRLQGLQAYVQALIAEIEFADENKFGPVVGHVLSTILFEHCPFSHEQLRTLRRDFQLWMQTQTDDKFFVKLLLMPIAIADDLYPGRGDALATANRIEELAESYRIKDIELDDSGDR